MRNIIRLATLLAITALVLPAAVVLTFEGLRNNEQVLNFYNGGSGGSGSGPGPNYGITFGSDSLAIIDADAGGTGNIANEPSASTALYFVTGPGAIMNVAAGFSTGFSFFYSAVSNPGTVTVYDGLNGTGAALGVFNLVANGSSCGGDPSGQYNCWTPVGVSFSGTAKSVNFSGSANQIAFDNVTLGSDTPGVPEPSTVVLAGAGLSLLYFVRRRA